MNRIPWLMFALLCGGCEHGVNDDDTEAEPIDTLDNQDLQGVYDCSERSDTGYRRGSSFAISVVTVDGRPVERSTANAYIALQEAAAHDGVDVRIVSGFRTMAEQEYFYGCYTNCNCNGCNLAARPGHSNHQSGHALDLNTSTGGVLTWLNNNGARFGFSRTVPSEAWHWEWWGAASDHIGPCGIDESCIHDPHFGGCAGSVITHCDENHQVSSGDCGVFGASCSTEGGSPHCVNPFCTIEIGGENGTFCVDDSERVATCTQGVVTEGDCAAFGATCSEEGGAGHCVHQQCLTNLDGAEDGTFCVDDATVGECTHGVPTLIDCAGSGGSCIESNGHAACSLPGAPIVPGDADSSNDGDRADDDAPTGETAGTDGTDDQKQRTTLAASVKHTGGCGAVDVFDGTPALLLFLLVPSRRRRVGPCVVVRRDSHRPSSTSARM